MEVCRQDIANTHSAGPSMIVFKLAFAVMGLHLARFIDQNPLGGLAIGAIVGHTVDLIVGLKISRFRRERLLARQARAAAHQHFLSSLFHMFGTVCGCDGSITKSEISAVEAIIKDSLKLSRKDRQTAIHHFRSARRSGASFQTSAAQYYELYQHHPEVLEGTMQMFMKLAVADGELNEQEIRLLKTAAFVFGLDERVLQQLQRTHLDVNGAYGDLEKSYSVLGCEQEASIEEIKKRYRKLVSTYHPDKIVSKDLPEEFLQFANQKMKDIQAAYEAVKAHRGFT